MGFSMERCLSALCGVAARLERALARVLKIDCYELHDDTLTRQCGLFRAESIAIDDVIRWWVVHEMTCDIVYIERNNGTVLRWLDRYDDLIGILERKVAAKRSDTP